MAVQAALTSAASSAVQGAQASVRLLTGGGFGTTGWNLGFEYPGNTTADPSLAVTATRFVLATNSDVYVQVISNGRDEGNVLGYVQLHTLFGVPSSDEVVQPHVVYDQSVHRLFLSALEVDLGSGGAPVASRVWLAYPVPSSRRRAVTQISVRRCSRRPAPGMHNARSASHSLAPPEIGKTRA